MTGNPGRWVMGDGLIEIRGENWIGRTGGLEESAEPPSGTVPDEGDEAGNFGGGTSG